VTGRQGWPGVALCLALGQLGCGEDSTIGGGGAAPCPPGSWLADDGTCVAAGLPPDLPCPPGELELAEGGCSPPGVPPDGCAEGFEHDGAHGCEPILPPEVCPPGLMAVPGETACRVIAPCAAGAWGDIPVEPNTQYVNLGYTGGQSDGSAQHPWTTVQGGVDAADAGAIVAVAAGTYAEDVRIAGKAVVLWGRCPDMVEIVSTGQQLAAVEVRALAHGSEVRDLALRGGDAGGLLVSGASGVLASRLWVDGTWWGIDVEDDLGPASVVVLDTLIEHSRGIGVYLNDTVVTLERSVVRATTVSPPPWGMGIGVQVDPGDGGNGASLTVRRSVVEQSMGYGVLAVGTTVHVEGSVVRDTTGVAPGTPGQPEGTHGRGISLEADPLSATPATGTVRGSLVADTKGMGIAVLSSTVAVDSTVVRESAAFGLESGDGVFIQPLPAGPVPSLTMRRSLLASSRQAGFLLFGGEATVEGVVVDNSLLHHEIWMGYGLAALVSPDGATRSSLTMRGSVVEGAIVAGLALQGATADLVGTVVRQSRLDSSGQFGRGVLAQADEPTALPTELRLAQVIVEDSHEAGVCITDSLAVIETSVIRRTEPNLEGLLGDGLVTWTTVDRATASLTGVLVEDSARGGVASFGADVALGSSQLRCHAFDLNGESYEAFDYAFQDLGGNGCGCPTASEPCQVVSANLEPPGPFGGAE